jgi:hypothetical protein
VRSHLLHAASLLARLTFDLEDGGDTFLRNAGSHTDYTALHISQNMGTFITVAVITSNPTVFLFRLILVIIKWSRVRFPGTTKKT